LITNKIRVFFNCQQRRILRKWIGCCRKVYNMVTADFRNTRVLRKQSVYRDMLARKMREEWPYISEVPYNARDEIIKEARANIKSAITALQRGHITHFSAPFRSRKTDTQVLPIRAQNITADLRIYPRMLFTRKLCQDTKGSKGKGKVNAKPPVKHVQAFRKHTNYDSTRTIRDSRLLYERRAKRWYLCLVSHKDGQTDSENQAVRCSKKNPSVVSLDPGNRTFFTWYSPTHGIGKVGAGDGGKLVKIGLRLDALYSKRTKTCRKNKANLNRAISKLRKRLENLRDDFHRKTASWLTKTFDIIVLPKFNTHLMARKGERKIGTKTVRGLMTWAHGKFRQILSNLCLSRGNPLIHPSEAYTSKTCSTCGWINESLGGKEVFRCAMQRC
jgi:putative transposase